jgi:WD40-like Beta Propeller Repeat
VTLWMILPMRRGLTCAIALVIAGACAAAGSGREASGLGRGTIIYAVTLRGEYPAVYRVDLVPHRWRRLIANADQPDVSRSGRRIAFVRRGDIWIADIDGTHQRRLTSTGRDLDPAWAPGDRILYFARKRGRIGTGAIYWIRARGGRAVQLTHPPGGASDDCHGAPAPDHKARVIAYEVYPNCIRHGEVRLAAIRRNGSPTDLLQLFRTTKNQLGLSWSPNSRFVAFGAFNTDQWDDNGIYVSQPNGDQPLRIWGEGDSPAPDEDWETAWSRRDGRIAFTAEAALWVSTPDGGLWDVTGHIAPSDSPSWLP